MAQPPHYQQQPQPGPQQQWGFRTFPDHTKALNMARSCGVFATFWSLLTLPVSIFGIIFAFIAAPRDEDGRIAMAQVFLAVAPWFLLAMVSLAVAGLLQLYASLVPILAGIEINTRRP